MADLSATKGIFPNVYQWESTDDAQGGSGGLMNRPPQNLLDRTQWLADALPAHRDFVNLSSSPFNTLTISQSGKLFSIDYTTPNGSVIDIILPNNSVSLPDATTFTFYNSSYDSVMNVNGQTSYGATSYINKHYTPISRIHVRPMEIVTLRRIPNQDPWQVVERQDIFGALREGVIINAINGSIPFRALNCNGAAVSRDFYSELFAAISTAYGVGNGTTTFNIPNLATGSVSGVSTNWYIYW